MVIADATILWDVPSIQYNFKEWYFSRNLLDKSIFDVFRSEDILQNKYREYTFFLWLFN